MITTTHTTATTTAHADSFIANEPLLKAYLARTRDYCLQSLDQEDATAFRIILAKAHTSLFNKR